MHYLDAVLAFLVALAVAAVLTPAAAVVARKVGAIAMPSERGLAQRVTPLLGGLAILAGVLLAALIWLPGTIKLPHTAHTARGAGGTVHTWTILAAAILISVVGAIDGVAFSIIAFDLHVPGAAILAALTAGASIGFLFHNYHPARVMMGDSGANLLGYLLGVAAVVGSLKTNAVVALVVPLVVLAVPFLDTGFVVAKRLKYRRKVWLADSNHFHHRMARIGFSQRKTVAYLYAWSVLLAGVAVALRFVPYHDHHAPFHYHPGWLALMITLGVAAIAASVYLVYVLEILKFKSFRIRELRRVEPETGEHEHEQQAEREIETGEFEAVGHPDTGEFERVGGE